MNFTARDLFISLEVGKSGGSTGQPCDIKRSRRGLVQEQSDPLVLWWVKLLKQEYSAGRLNAFSQRSYRRSRWGLAAAKPSSPISPFSAMHKDGRLLTSSLGAFSLVLGLTASLNVVALAEPAVSGSTVSTHEIPSAERFSMMKDFAGRHNQYLDLSKLNEFKWTDETRVTARSLNQKRHTNRVFTETDGGLVAQPLAVQSEKRRPKKNDAELTGSKPSPMRQLETGSTAGFRSVQETDLRSQSSGQSTGDLLLDSSNQPN